MRRLEHPTSFFFVAKLKMVRLGESATKELIVRGRVYDVTDFVKRTFNGWKREMGERGGERRGREEREEWIREGRRERERERESGGGGGGGGKACG